MITLRKGDAYISIICYSPTIRAFSPLIISRCRTQTFEVILIEEIAPKTIDGSNRLISGSNGNGYFSFDQDNTCLTKNIFIRKILLNHMVLQHIAGLKIDYHVTRLK